MSKRTLTGVLLTLTFLLVSCSGAVNTDGDNSGAVEEAAVPTAVPATPVLQEEAEPTAPLDPSCVPNEPNPTPPAEVREIFDPKPEEDWIKGPDDAAVTIVEYADFQCPYCATVGPVLDELREAFPEDVRVVYRHYPLQSIHDKAVLATQAAEAAGLQGEFWAMHDLLYAKQADWSDLSVEDFKTWVTEEAAGLGLDEEQFAADLTSEEITALAEDTWKTGQEIGIPGTPFIMINNQQFKARPQLSTLTAIVKMIKLEDQQYSSCPPLTVDEDATYTATLETEQGDIVIELYPDVAPLAVNNFLFLAEEGWYNGITFHRVIPEFMAQTGDPTGTGYGGPGYKFGIEVDPELTFDRAGLVAYANSGPESNGSQFFITYGPAPDLDGQYTIFGEVVEGLDIAQNLTPRDPSQGFGQAPGDTLISVTVEKQ
jgi:cyclophilin family peptidyl-prolyl cis-trans isomerase/protein-disulfide isomerase